MVGALLRLYKVKENSDFTEYKEEAFRNAHTEKTLENWLEKNSDSIVEDGALLIIGRQVTTNLGSFIDLLALDREGSTVMVELKRGKTPRDTIAQALEYSSWVETLQFEDLEQILRDYMNDENLSLTEYHRAYFKLEESQGVSFNKDQRIVVVGYQISQEIRQTAIFLRKKGLRATCVEFNYFKADPTEQLMSVEIVVGKEPIKKDKIKTETRPKINKKGFIEDLDQAAFPVFKTILDLAERNDFLIRWGAIGFSLSVNVEDTNIPFLMGYPKSSAYSQTVYTYYPSIIKKVREGEELFKAFKEKLGKTGLFKTAGNEMKYVIRHKPIDEKIKELSNLISEFTQTIKKAGLAE